MEDPVDFDVAVEHLDDRVVVHVEGDLDMASADAFEQAVSPVTSTPHVVLDLGWCTFLDSTGMRLVAATVRKAPRVSIVATDPGVRRVLEITAVDTKVVVHSSLDEAL